MYKSFSMELAGRTLTVDVGRVAKQANGAAFMHYGDTVVLSTATASEKPRDGIDFFPLSVEYEEKMYAVGKIPGGFNKREGKASEHAILTSRVIDRPMRPLFPKDYRNDVTLNNMVMSVDPECDPEVVAMLGSAIATCISDIPFDGPCAMTQIGMIDGAMGVGKTTVSQQLKKDLANSVFLDGDWCWDADPFQVTDETKEMVMDNICYLLNNFLHCSAYENVIFCWVMHEQSIVDEIVSKLDTEECRVIKISLIVDEANLRKRLLSDIANKIRTEEIMDKSIARIQMYQVLDTVKIDTSNKSVCEITEEIAAL